MIMPNIFLYKWACPVPLEFLIHAERDRFFAEHVPTTKTEFLHFQFWYYFHSTWGSWNANLNFKGSFNFMPKKSYYLNIDKNFVIGHDYLELISRLIWFLEKQKFFCVENPRLFSCIKSQFAQKLSHVTPKLSHFTYLKRLVTWNERLATYDAWK